MKIFISCLAVFRYNFTILLGMICICGRLSAEGVPNDYVLNVSAVGLAGNYEVFFDEFCKLSETEAYDFKIVAEKCKASGLFDPMANSNVFLKNTSGEIVQTQTTDSQGKCTFRDIPLAPYYVEIVAERASALTGRAEKITYRRSNFDALTCTYVDEITIEGHYFVAEIQGRVVDSKGAAVQGVKVKIKMEECYRQKLQIHPIELIATTDNSGKYMIPMIQLEGFDFLEFNMWCQAVFRYKSSKWFPTLLQIEAIDGTGQVGHSVPFFAITEELHHYFFLVFERGRNGQYWHGMKDLDPKRKYSNVPKSKGHVLMIPDIVLDDSNQE